MKPKFEYPGYMVADDDKQHRLMLAWADYNANYMEHLGTIRQIGSQILAGIAMSKIRPEDNNAICKKLIEVSVPGMNDAMDDLELAINSMKGWHVSWTESNTNRHEPMQTISSYGWIVQGVAVRSAHNLANGSMAWMHVGDTPTATVGQIVNLSSMQQIKFTAPA